MGVSRVQLHIVFENLILLPYPGNLQLAFVLDCTPVLATIMGIRSGLAPAHQPPSPGIRNAFPVPCLTASTFMSKSPGWITRSSAMIASESLLQMFRPGSKPPGISSASVSTREVQLILKVDLTLPAIQTCARLKSASFANWMILPNH